MTFPNVTVIGRGLIGSSLARAVQLHIPGVRVIGYDADANVRETAARIKLCDHIAENASAAVIDAALKVLCVPVGAMGALAAEMAGNIPSDAILSDVGSCKA